MATIRLSDFIAPFKGAIKAEELSRLSIAAAADITDRYLEQVAINDRIASELVVAVAENGGLVTQVVNLIGSLAALRAEFDAMQAVGLVHGVLTHDPAIDFAYDVPGLPACSISLEYSQITLFPSGASINRIPTYLDSQGNPHVSTSVTPTVTYTVDGAPIPWPYVVDTGVYLALTGNKRNYWVEQFRDPVPPHTRPNNGDFDVYIDVPNIRGIGANVITVSPLPLTATTIYSIEYKSTSGIYVPINKTTPLLGRQRLYFGVKDFGNGLHIAINTTAPGADYTGGLYEVSLLQQSFADTGAFAGRLGPNTVTGIKAITSFEVDYDLFGLDKTYDPAQFAKFDIWGSDVMDVPKWPLNIPVGLTKEMPPIDVSNYNMDYLFVVGEFHQYNGTTPVYNGAKVTYLL